MTKSQRHKTPTTLPVNALTDPGADWTVRRSKLAVPFDVIILCQDAAFAENRLLYDEGAEFAAVFQDKRRIYRLKDGRFATMANRVEVMKGSPMTIDFWNWWTEYATPGLTDFEQSTKIDAIIADRKANPQPITSTLV